MSYHHCNGTKKGVVMAKIIVVANGKGGVGKTDTAKNVSYCLAKQGSMVLMVDLDHQGNGSRVMTGGSYSFDVTMTDVFATKGVEVIKAIVPAVDGKTEEEIDNLFIAPASPLFGEAVIAAHQRTRREQILEKALKGVVDDFDYIVIDCAPSLDLSALNAINIADLIVSPIGDVVSVEATASLYSKVLDLREDDMPLCYMFRTMKDGRASIENDLIDHDIAENLIPRFEAEINRCANVSKSIVANQAVCAYKKGSVVAMKYKELTKEIVEVLE